ncbi:MAG TPA: transcription elongation factor subunit Spt4 [archaeon]|nr:transcription elongation factor subunit Spt4 [archaeon]
MKQKACRNCRYVMEEGDTCPKCGNKQFTTFWKGYVAIIDPEKSQIAEKMGIKATGKYALRLSR